MKSSESESPRCLVTGAAGYVGSWLVKQLLLQGYNVRASIRSCRGRDVLEAQGASVVLADIRDAAAVREVMEGITHVFHIAAIFRDAGLPDSEYFAANLDGVRNVFEAAIQAGVKRIVHCSTNGVHSVKEGAAASEDSPFSPSDIYQESKLKGELLAGEYFRSGKIEGAILRPAMVYGPNDERFLKMFRMIARKRFFYVGKGDVATHWIDVRDLARAFELAMFHDQSNSEAYLIAGNGPLPLNEMCAKIARRVDVKPPWIHLPIQPMLILGDICEAICTSIKIKPPIFRRRVNFYLRSRRFNVDKAKRMLGFGPSQTLDEEIADIVESYRASGLL